MSQDAPSKADERVRRVMQSLEEHGWREAGQTEPRFLGKKSLAFGGEVFVAPARSRFNAPEGPWRATVGKVTTNFYLPEPGKRFDEWLFCGYKTRDAHGVERFLKNHTPNRAACEPEEQTQ